MKEARGQEVSGVSFEVHINMKSALLVCCAAVLVFVSMAPETHAARSSNDLAMVVDGSEHELERCVPREGADAKLGDCCTTDADCSVSASELRCLPHGSQRMCALPSNLGCLGWWNPCNPSNDDCCAGLTCREDWMTYHKATYACMAL